MIQFDIVKSQIFIYGLNQERVNESLNINCLPVSPVPLWTFDLQDTNAGR